MQISNDKVALFHYTLTNKDGQVLDTSDGREPLAYIHGKNNIIPGLESQLNGKTAGDKLTVTVQPEEAYGVYNQELIHDIPRTSFGEIKDIQPGMQFQMMAGNSPVIVTVISAADDTVKVDANHPLAGEVLTFDVEITEVRDASQEELEHGHVHGTGGHHH